MKFGNYQIGQKFSEIDNELKEISISEYRVLKPSFKDEKIYNGKDIEYLGANWKTIIGVTENRVYKFSLQTNYTNNLLRGSLVKEDLWDKVYNDLIKDFGIFTKQQKVDKSFFTISDREWGNIILTLTVIPHADSIIESEIVLDLSFTGSFRFKKSRFWKKIFAAR